jgi:cell division control protein 24
MGAFTRSDVKVQRLRIDAELSVTSNTTYHSVVESIGSELLMMTRSNLGRLELRIKYRDEDGDLVLLENDDDIKLAIANIQGGLDDEGEGLEKEYKLFCTAEVV